MNSTELRLFTKRPPDIKVLGFDLMLRVWLFACHLSSPSIKVHCSFVHRSGLQ